MHQSPNRLIRNSITRRIYWSLWHHRHLSTHGTRLWVCCDMGEFAERQFCIVHIECWRGGCHFTFVWQKPPSPSTLLPHVYLQCRSVVVYTIQSEGWIINFGDLIRSLDRCLSHLQITLCVFGEPNLNEPVVSVVVFKYFVRWSRNQGNDNQRHNLKAPNNEWIDEWWSCSAKSFLAKVEMRHELLSPTF